MSFEKDLERLEAIVHELEAGELPLADAIRKFEQGMRLSKACTAKLDDTEKRIRRMAAGETDAGETDAGETDAGETDAGETDGETDGGEAAPDPEAEAAT